MDTGRGEEDNAGCAASLAHRVRPGLEEFVRIAFHTPFSAFHPPIRVFHHCHQPGNMALAYDVLAHA